MMPSTTPAAEESARLKALHAFGILDTPEEPDFDDITRIASEICGTPISLITLVDDKRTWHKSKQGLELSEVPREQSLCNIAIQQPQQVLYMPDTGQDRRAVGLSLVAYPGRAESSGETGALLSFYAGVVLADTDGYKLGSLCVADYKPRELSAEQLAALRALGSQVMRQMELRRTLRLLQETQRQRDEAYAELESFTHIIAHDLKSPLNNIFSLYDILQMQMGEAAIPPDAQRTLAYVGQSALRLSEMIDAVLEYSRQSSGTEENAETLSLGAVVMETLALLKKDADTELIVEVPRTLKLRTQRTMLTQVLINLVSNGYRYTARPGGRLRIAAHREGYSVVLRVEDNGPGMSAEKRKGLFQLFDRSGAPDNFENPDGSKRHGIGMATVHKLVQRLGGSIAVDSTEGVGATFTVTLPDLD